MCGNDFGMPSGHSTFSMHICMMIGFELIANGFSWIWTFLLSAVAIIIGISRLYVGVHSIDQIMMGW